ncbi:hypothetical protein GCM10009867_05800 [Pedococcus aerophilus]|uniref:DUF732 domain-containing protein n=1 Tax=Pedococcus aerophilus TaxID=436356 RepID=A0ABN3UFI7_9MICO
MLLVGLMGACGEGAEDQDVNAGSQDKSPTVSRSTGVDTAAWIRELAIAGVTDLDMSKVEALTRDMCDDSQEELTTFASLQKDAGEPMDVLRINFRFVCPDQVDKLQAAEAQLENATDSVQEACDMEPTARTQDQQQLAELMGC